MSFERLLATWEDESASIDLKYVPLVPLPLAPGALVFVGLNPSFNSTAARSLVPELEVAPEDYFAWDNRVDFDWRVDHDLHTRAKEKYAYFSKFRMIARALDVPWDHQDLFFWRETNQSDLRPLVLVGNNPKHLTRFALRQLNVSIELLEQSSPRALVVANALASDIFLDLMSLEFDKTSGCHRCSLGGTDVPVFLSSMLTGQRALDRHSMRRLVWHLGQVLGRDADLSDF